MAKAQLEREGRPPRVADDIERRQPERPDEARETVGVVRHRRARREIRGPATARSVPGDDSELVSKRLNRQAPHPAVGYCAVQEQQRAAVAGAPVADLQLSDAHLAHAGPPRSSNPCILRPEQSGLGRHPCWAIWTHESAADMFGRDPPTAPRRTPAGALGRNRNDVYLTSFTCERRRSLSASSAVKFGLWVA